MRHVKCSTGVKLGIAYEVPRRLMQVRSNSPPEIAEESSFLTRGLCLISEVS